ncbi:hypothetical protein GCM10010503_67230 [Streptomyces lucensis JCM 4490]|uniref:Uncharacterized protein n=1 Tax=Streptomyces lucensis JCM 4490 TaxID=1306176 RepID=A0A918JH10_9ACTN|nr:hypothetical protein [Streptomyces lucensis]GGW80384.1 hypothetical protein GCM10010503_67230 [Streptomyces lucensis JCM 4490]
MHTGLLRTVGALTFAYGVTTACRPELLARPCGLVGPDGDVAPHTAAVLRPLAWRDAASGLAMVVAPEGPALATAAAVRIASDVGDAVLFGSALPGRLRRAGAVVTALGWAGLTVAGLVGRPEPARRHRLACRCAAGRTPQ